MMLSCHSVNMKWVSFLSILLSEHEINSVKHTVATKYHALVSNKILIQDSRKLVGFNMNTRNRFIVPACCYIGKPFDYIFRALCIHLFDWTNTYYHRNILCTIRLPNQITWNSIFVCWKHATNFNWNSKYLSIMRVHNLWIEYACIPDPIPCFNSVSSSTECVLDLTGINNSATDNPCLACSWPGMGVMSKP